MFEIFQFLLNSTSLYLFTPSYLSLIYSREFLLDICIFLFLVSSGCTSRDVEKAFNGDLRPGKANRVIGEYCQSCHIHKDFDPPLHVSEVRNLYSSSVFNKARECRTCHYIEKNWMHNQHERKTLMPEDENRKKLKKS